MKTAPRLAIGAITFALLAGAVLAVGAVLAWDKRQALFAFAQVAHRQLSQRVEQHDAHLTSLSALAQASHPAPEEAIRQVSASIRQFYPRIVGIDVIAFEAGAARSLLSEALAPAVLEVARHATPVATLSLAGERLLLTKRAGADDARYHVLVLTLDPSRLMALDQPVPVEAAFGLSFEGRMLAVIGLGPQMTNRIFDAPLASRTHPLVLSLTSSIGWWMLPSPLQLAIMLALAFFGGVLAERWMEASVRAREAARISARAKLDARLAHAGRINAMGEMASGIAHELTQPLTAILAQAQAGQRLMQRPDPDAALAGAAFEAVARNAKRAGDILAKLRSWISHGETTPEPVNLADVAQDVAGLIRLNGLPPGVTLELDLGVAAPAVLADRTQIEQVVFNLMRNGLEAVEAHEGMRRVRLTVTAEEGRGIVRVEDSGPGLSAAARERLFEPFYTTKAKGMGLGLALCLTLVERFGGTLVADASDLGGAAFTARLPLVQEAMA